MNGKVTGLWQLPGKNPHASRYYWKRNMQMNTDRIIIIPDVHGRTFWREAVKGHENDTIIFLGDYLDPYSFEEITPGDSFRELRAIVDFKKGHADNVTLLLGNHDLGYVEPVVNECRRDIYMAERNRRFLLENLDLFDLVHIEKCDGVDVLFTHAGIRDAWVQLNSRLWQEDGFDPLELNRMLHDPSLRTGLMTALSNTSYLRGGFDSCGSLVWADANEFIQYGDFLPGYLQVFGHTLHSGGPVLIKAESAEGWCVDCREAFQMDRQGNLDFLD